MPLLTCSAVQPKVINLTAGEPAVPPVHPSPVRPVFLDETEDPDIALSQSAFEPVWQVLKVL